MKRTLIVATVVALGLGLAFSLQAENQIDPQKAAYMEAHPESSAVTGPVVRQLDEPVQTQHRKGSRAIGSIAYDDGVVTALPGVTSHCFGNRFNTFTGSPVMANGMLTEMSVFVASGAGTDGIFVSLYGPVNTTAGTAPFVGDEFVTLTAGSGTWNAINLTGFTTPWSYSGPSFLAGVWYIAGDSVGLGTGTTNGQGHHGMMINDIVGTGYTELSGLNALVRVTGDIVPVELMHFTIE